MVENIRLIPEQEVKQAPQTPESVNPLTLTLSQEAQGWLLAALTRDLRERTRLETRGNYADQPEEIKLTKELRGVTSTLFKSLNIGFLNDEGYLKVGLLDLIPDKNKRLNEWANMEVVLDDEMEIKSTAQYFQAEEAKKQKTENS